MNTNTRFSCPECRYDLASLVNSDGVRCPECGTMFTRTALADGIHAAAVRWVPLSIPIMWGVGAAAGILLVLVPPRDDFVLPTLFGVPYIAGAAWCYTVLSRADRVSLVLIPATPGRRLTTALLSGLLAAIFFPIVLIGWVLTVGVLMLAAQAF